MLTTRQTEREMPLIQRGIVDSCFEEGHYEYGIGVLDRLRANGYRPFPLHIRQLVFIALYPPPPEIPRRTERVDTPSPSPSKAQLGLQRQKDDLWPKPTSRPLAIALLNAFVRTNFPESLMRALPYYQYVDNDGVSDVDPFQEYEKEDSFEDISPLKDEVLAMQRLKDCWELLREGLVERKQGDRSRAEVDLNLHANSVVGLYAWPVLEWLICVFEKDEMLAREQEQGQYSRLLLCQVPPPRSKRGPRWDAEMPLKVAFACFVSHSQGPVQSRKFVTSEEKRFDLGTRLIALLVNLTMSKPSLLSPSHFLRYLVQRFSELPMPSLEAFLAAIPLRQVPFKIALLESYISQENASNTRLTETPLVSAPRAKPKFNGKGAAVPEATSTAVPSGSQDRDKDAYPIPTADRLLELLASPLPVLESDDFTASPPPQPSPAVASAAKLAYAKFQLFSAILGLHVSHRDGNADFHWTTAVREGRLRKSIQAGFQLRDRAGVEIEGDGEIKKYLFHALEQVRLWEIYEG